MLSDLPIGPLNRAIKWLAWLIGIASLLLIISTASFNYVESEATIAQLENFRKIESDTLPREISKKAITIAGLLANPTKYHNQRVWVKGYLNLEFEGDAIYWRQVDYRNGKYRNALWVNFADSLLQAKRIANYSKYYVLIEGIFVDGPGGHGSLNPGTINNITSVNALHEDIK